MSVCSISSIGDVFSNKALYSALKSNQWSLQLPGLFVGSYGTPLVSSSIRCNPIQVLKPMFGYKTCSLGTLVNPIVSFRSPFICVYILGSFTVLGYHTTLQMALNFNYLSLYSFPYPFLPYLSPDRKSVV